MQEPTKYIEVPKVDPKTAATQMATLRDVAVPPPVSWRPQTAGWYILGALVLAAVAWLAWRWYRRWLANRYRRDALAALGALEPALGNPAERMAALRQIATIVKRTQLSETQRSVVASLSGTVWLESLDKSGTRHRFSAPPLDMLGELSSATDETLAKINSKDIATLTDALRQWVGASHAGIR